MRRLDLARWKQTIGDLNRLAIESDHVRTRQRFAVLVRVAQGAAYGAIATEFDVHRTQPSKWIRLYNDGGPDALIYRHSGGHAPLLARGKRRNSKRS